MTALEPVVAPSAGDIAGRVLRELDALIPRMARAYRVELPEYAALDDDAMADVQSTSRRFVEDFLVRVATGDELPSAELADMSTAGEKRLHMGVSLDSAMHAFRIAGREAWRAVVAATGDDEHHLLADLAAHWIDYIDRASSAFAKGYLAASHEHLRRLDAQRRAIVDALLQATDAGDVAAVAARWSLTLARAYTPLLAAGEHLPATIDGVLAAAPAGSLAGERGDRVVLLVPEGAPPPEVSDAVVAVGRPAAPGPALLAEVKSVEAVVDAAVAAGHRHGTFGPDDLLHEQLVAASPRVAASLRRLVREPLAAHDPDGLFTATLRTYLATGSVPETARREHVHANTVAYRLKRVRDITGFDPKTPREAALLVLALETPTEVAP